MRQPERSILLELEGPEGHPARDLQLLSQCDVLRVRLRLRQVREEVFDGGVAHGLERRRNHYRRQGDQCGSAATSFGLTWAV